MSSVLLQKSYESFATFGVSKSNVSLNSNNITMDNAHFAKLCRDAKITDNKCTPVDVDLIFKKVVSKGERKIDFAQFQEALKLLAQKKYPNDKLAMEKMSKLIMSASPNTQATQAVASGIYAKLTDTSLYTGTHKERFDDQGKGRGLDGREPVNSTHDLSQIVNRKSGTAAATNAPISINNISAASKKRGQTASMNQLTASAKSQQSINVTKSKQNISAPVAKKQNATGPGGKTVLKKPQPAAPAKSTGNLAASYKPVSASNLSKTGNGSSVFDRLTNTNAYTGTHKHRFDETGRGLGSMGRDQGPGAGAVQLSQLLRK